MPRKIINEPQVKCPACSCTYAFGKEDIKEQREIARRFGKDILKSYKYVECPICGQRHVINIKKIK